jgi:hypothetical protein
VVGTAAETLDVAGGDVAAVGADGVGQVAGELAGGAAVRRAGLLWLARRGG